MKTILLTSTASSSVNSTTTAMEEEDEKSENRDSCYYPGCRKDANCNCEICLASINATLDLMPLSIQKSSLTKFSASRPNIEKTPISFDRSVLSTPRSNTPRIQPCIKPRSSGKLKLDHKTQKSERNWGFRCDFRKLILVLSLIFVADSVFSWTISKVFWPKLSPDRVMNLGENSGFVKDLNGKLRFLQKELQSMIDGKISNCSYVNTKWEINQDTLLLYSKCTLLKSAVEEVSIWGWPLQTAGLLTSGFSHRSFTVLSGRVTEWSDGRIGYSIRKANTSWVQTKLGASAVQLDPNTWVLEYRQSFLSDNSRLYRVVLEFFKQRLITVIRGLKQDFWFFSNLENKFGQVRGKYDIKIPT